MASSGSKSNACNKSKIILNAERIVSTSSVLFGDYNPERNGVTITKICGNKLKAYGIRVGNEHFLNNFESLYLLERHFLQIFYEGHLLTMQHCHALFIKTSRDIGIYRVYSDLNDRGYRMLLKIRKTNILNKNISDEVGKISENLDNSRNILINFNDEGVIHSTTTETDSNLVKRRNDNISDDVQVPKQKSEFNERKKADSVDRKNKINIVYDKDTTELKPDNLQIELKTENTDGLTKRKLQTDTKKNNSDNNNAEDLKKRKLDNDKDNDDVIILENEIDVESIPVDDSTSEDDALNFSDEDFDSKQFLNIPVEIDNNLLKIYFDVYDSPDSLSKRNSQPPNFRLFIIQGESDDIASEIFIYYLKQICTDSVPIKMAIVNEDDTSYTLIKYKKLRM